MDNMTWHRHSSAAVTGRGESTERFQCCDHALFFHPGASYSVPRWREAESSIPATMSGSSQKRHSSTVPNAQNAAQERTDRANPDAVYRD